MDLSPLDTDVVAARTGDRDAFARLVTRYRGLVSSISLSTVGNVATSDDVAQEVFLAAWRDIGTLRNPSSFLPWLRQLTRHRSLDAVRSGRRPDRFVDDATLEAAVDPHPTAQDALLQNEHARAVMLALDGLPDDAREVITLYYREGQSIEQVARLLGLREDTAKKRLSRARAALRDEVLARFADAVETTAPGDGFTTQVMAALPVMSPAAAAVVGKGAMYLLGKSAVVAASWSGLAGLIPLLWGMRRNLRAAFDERERREMRLIFLSLMANILLFSLGVAALPPRGPSTGLARTWLGIALTVGAAAIHFGIFLVWYPRARARRRSAEVLADPSATGRHAREDRRGRILVLIAGAMIAATIVAIWVFR
jgi:RNA polymerase sigma factor (sigma-70 family)